MHGQSTCPSGHVSAARHISVTDVSSADVARSRKTRQDRRPQKIPFQENADQKFDVGWLGKNIASAGFDRLNGVGESAKAAMDQCPAAWIAPRYILDEIDPVAIIESEFNNGEGRSRFEQVFSGDVRVVSEAYVKAILHQSSDQR